MESGPRIYPYARLQSNLEKVTIIRVYQAREDAKAVVKDVFYEPAARYGQRCP